MALKILPIAEALKKIYIKLGGDSAEVLDMSTTTELIQEIAELPLGGGGGGGSLIYHIIMGEERPTGLQESYNQMAEKFSNGIPVAFVESEQGFFYPQLALLFAPAGLAISTDTITSDNNWVFIAPDGDADAPMIYER